MWSKTESTDQRPPLTLASIDSLEAYRDFYFSMMEEYKARRRCELELSPSRPGTFHTCGYCHVCAGPVRFMSDLLYSDGREVEGKRIPNWRERLICEGCGLNNRVRAAIHYFEEVLRPSSQAHIYLTEQSTPLYRWLAAKYPALAGSEYFGDRLPYGQTDAATGFRNESITKLTFGDASLNFILSFDVFEHVPHYQMAFAECHRTLRPGGALLFTVPFAKGTQENNVRARVNDKGEIEHLCEPQYHGDPVNQQGCLSFYTFGWRIIDDLKRAGFARAACHFYWSDSLGYLGEEQFLFTAHK
jgi:SAM-dependent methyltransferase